MITANHLSSNTNNSKMPSRRRSTQSRYEAEASSRSDGNKSMPSIMTRDSKDHHRRGVAASMKQVSKRSVHSESSGSKLSGMTGLEPEFDLDKHRDYDIARSRRRYEECESPRASSTQGDDNLTDEQRAWAGIDAILDDDGSVGEETDVLPEGIMAALQQSPTRGGHDCDEEDDVDEDDSDDSHDHALKMFCGYSAKEDGGDMPTLMNSSFSSQFSQESARSVFSYLSRNNIIVQRDIQDGPLKSFLTEMAYNIEQGEALNEEDEHNNQQPDSDDDDDETEIQLLEESYRRDGEEATQNRRKEEDDTSTSLDPIGQQIINAIMMEMNRMKESDEYDEDDHVYDEAYDEDEYEEVVVEDEDDEYYDDGKQQDEYPMEYNTEEYAPVSPPQSQSKNSSGSPKESPKNSAVSKPKQGPVVDPRELPPLKDFVPEDECNNSIASMDTFQDDEVCKILTHQNPMAWASFGDLHFDSNHVTEQSELPSTPLDDEDDDDFHSQSSPHENGPVSPLRSIKDQIMSGVVQPSSPIVQKEPQSPQRSPLPQSPSKSKNRQSLSKSPMKKKKKPPAAGGAEAVPRRKSVRNSGAPLKETRQSTTRSKNPNATPKVMRKSVSRPVDGATPTPKGMRKSVRRQDETTTTPKLVRKSISRPDGTAPTPKPVRKSASRQSPPKTPQQGKKPSGRPVAKRNPSIRTDERDNGVRRSVSARKVRPVGQEPSSPQSDVRSTKPGESIPQTPSRTPSMVRKKKVNGTSAKGSSL